jgi:molybdenum cofactor biosynthesis enzyme MoaA
MKKCYYPFSNLTINPSGNAVPCCKYNLNRSDRLIEEKTLFDSNIKELFYQPAMEKIREQFRNGEQPKACETCWQEEDAGIVSLRQLRLKNVDFSPYRSKKYTDIISNPKILSLDFKFSSLCNLKCRICGPYCSSSWLKESLDTNQFDQNTIDFFSKYAERKFINNQENFEIFKDILPNLQTLEFYGGEPFLQPEHDRIMDILATESNVPNKQISLWYNTNGTIFDADYIKPWSKMNYIELNISIDDIFERFEYQRYPAKFENVVDNIYKYKAMNLDSMEISLYYTVSLFNIFYIDEFLNWNANSLKCKVRLNLLHFPNNTSIKHLPSAVKEMVKNKIQNIPAESLQFIDSNFDITNIVNYMMNNTGSDKSLNEFYNNYKKHDKYRSQNFDLTFDCYHKALLPFLGERE